MRSVSTEVIASALTRRCPSLRKRGIGVLLQSRARGRHDPRRSRRRVQYRRCEGNSRRGAGQIEVFFNKANDALWVSSPRKDDIGAVLVEHDSLYAAVGVAHALQPVARVLAALVRATLERALR